MTNITWKQTENYEWTGTDEKENYYLIVAQGRKTLKWYWAILRDEDKTATSLYEEEDRFDNADTAKQDAERALENYLNEQNDFTNCLREVMKVEKL